MDFDPEGKTVIGLSTGQTAFGRFALDRVLGQGAMGVVWLAEDSELGEKVALKFLPPILAADPAALEELKEEARQSRRLTHENIVRIHDLVRDEHGAAISMEWVDGLTFSALRLSRPARVMEIEDLKPLLPQIVSALDYAHERAKVVHRDLKPSNLMVSREGVVKITDFGIARSLTDSVTRLTQAGTSGTPSYMSPQQMMGKRPSPADDLYALGATLYEMLTGKPPFYTGDLGMQVLHAAPAPVSDRRKELGVAGGPLPASWEEALWRCLSKDPAERPATAGALLELLELEARFDPQPLRGQAGYGAVAAAGAATGGSRSSQGRDRTRDRFSELLVAGRFHEAKALLLSPMLEESETPAMRDKLERAVASAWAVEEPALMASLREERWKEARERLRNWCERCPDELQVGGLSALEKHLPRMAEQQELALAEAWKDLQRQRQEWDANEQLDRWGPVLTEISEEVIASAVMEEVERRLLDGKLAEAYRMLEGLRASGLCPEYTRNLKPRMEAIRTEANRNVERELEDLEAQARSGNLSSAAVEQWRTGLRSRYLPSPGASDPILERLGRLEADDGVSSGAPPPLPNEPPPLPVRKAGKKGSVAGKAPAANEPLPMGGEATGETGRRRGIPLLALLTVPLLAVLLYFFVIDPYRYGLAELDEIGWLIETGEVEEAAERLKDLESDRLAAWMVTPGLRELRSSLGFDAILDLLFPVYPGLREAYSGFRAAYPGGAVVRFTGDWDELVARVEAAAPGTVFVIEEPVMHMTGSLEVRKPFGFVGGVEGTVWHGVMDLASHDGLITVGDTGVLFGGLELDIVGYEGSETPVFSLKDSKGWMASVKLSASAADGVFVGESFFDGRELEVSSSPDSTGIAAVGSGTRMRLENTEVHGAKLGVLAMSGADLEMYGCRIHSIAEVALGLEGLNTGAMVRDSIFENSLAGLAAVEGTSLAVSQSRFINNSQFGLLAKGSIIALEDCTVENNRVGLQADGDGVLLMMKNCLVAGNRNEGLLAVSGAIVSVEASTFTDNEVGLTAEDKGTNLSVRGTAIGGNGVAGLVLYAGAHGEFHGNRIFDHGEDGVFVIGDNTYLIAEQNRIESNNRSGLTFVEGAQGWVEGNEILNNDEAGIVAADSRTHVKILRNSFKENGIGILVNHGSSAEVLDNTSENNQRDGLRVQGRNSEAVVARNVLRNNNGAGMSREPNTRVRVLEANRITGNRGGNEDG